MENSIKVDKVKLIVERLKRHLTPFAGYELIIIILFLFLLRSSAFDLFSFSWIISSAFWIVARLFIVFFSGGPIQRHQQPFVTTVTVELPIVLFIYQPPIFAICKNKHPAIKFGIFLDF